MLFNGNNIVIPSTMHDYILKLVHEGHQGINSCIRHAKTTVYWPSIDDDITKFISQCPTCLTYRHNNAKQPIIHHEYKMLPWSKVGVDIFEFNKSKYLIVIDYYSKYVEIAYLKSDSTAKTLIIHLKTNLHVMAYQKP